MYYIVEKIDQLEKLKPSETAFVQLIFCDKSFHPKLSKPSLVYYNNGEKGYIFALDHSESFSLPIEKVVEFLAQHLKIYVIDSKSHLYHIDIKNLIDLNLVMLDSTNEIKEFNCDTQFHRQLYQKQIKNADHIIPISKHYERCECLYDSVKYLIGLDIDQSYDKRILDAYRYVESSGIKVKEEHLKKVYDLPNSSGLIREGLAYSYYNLYNLTARPTNSFLGLNFLAIPKEGESRSCFLPDNDFLVEFDFDSYHLRLIAKLVGYSLSEKESIHKKLAGEYFQKPIDQITDQEYKQAKTITFRQLYGGVEEQYKHIDFLSSMSSFIDIEYKKYKAQSSYVLPTGRIVKKHSTITKYKLFNYILQNLETKTNVEKIEKVKQYLEDKKTKLILITYDAFLFDFSVQDGKETLLGLKDILEQGGIPTKHTYGKDYSFNSH
jgi:hypothetical protein